MCDCERAAGVERQGQEWGRGGETPAGPALRCRWAGPAAGPAALAALGSRPRRAPRAGLGLRGGAGTGSGKRQCSGGGGALPLREPSAGRRAGAAVSRERGPRSPHGRRRGESRERPGAGCNLRRRDAPAAEPPLPHPGLGPPGPLPPRLGLGSCSPPTHRTPIVLPRIPLLSQAREVLPSCPGPCPAFSATPHYPGTRSPLLGRHLLPWPHFGVRPGVRVPAGRRGVADVPGAPGWPYRPCRRGPGRPTLAGNRARTAVPTLPRGSTR